MINVIGPNNAQSEKKIPIPSNVKRISFKADKSMTFPESFFEGGMRGRMSRFPTTREHRKTKPTIRTVQGKPTVVKRRRMAMGRTIPATEPPVKVIPEARPRW